MRRYLITLVLMAALAVSASAHGLWVETKDMAEIGNVRDEDMRTKWC